MRVRDPKTGRNVVVEEMTYEQWERWVQSRTYSDIIGKRTSNGIEIKMVSATQSTVGTKEAWHLRMFSML